jgi:benzoylformate decarboxylase
MPSMTGKQALLEQLIADGTKYIFGNPGTTEQGIMDALQDYPQLKFILGLHEGVAVSMGDAYARATRKPAVVELHTAPGLGNGLGMLHNAARGHTPLVVIAGQANLRGIYAEPVLSGDLIGYARPICKWVAEARYAEEVPMLMRRAMKVAADPPAGPVFLSLPLDVLEQSEEMTIAPSTFSRWRARPEAEALQEAAKMLAGAARPMIVTGDAVGVGRAHSELTALAELIGAPIFVGSNSDISAPAHHPLVSGGYGQLYALANGPEAGDVLLLVGTVEGGSLTGPIPALPSNARIIEIHTDTWELAKTNIVDLAIVADPRAALAELADAVRAMYSADQAQAAARRKDDISSRQLAARERALEQDRARRDQVPIAPSRLMEEIAAALPAEGAVFDEAITSGGLDRYMEPVLGRYFRPRGGGIGGGLPGTLGLQLALPNNPVLGIEGDGSAMYSITALWTAAHYDLPVTWVVCNNAAYRILKVNVLIHLGEAAAGREFQEMDLTNPAINYARIAESMSCQGIRVEHPDQLGDALRTALAHPGPSLVDVVLDGSIPGRP